MSNTPFAAEAVFALVLIFLNTLYVVLIGLSIALPAWRKRADARRTEPSSPTGSPTRVHHEIFPAARIPDAVVIIAPKQAGKSRNEAALMRMFNCTSVVDEWDGRTPLPHGALALTNASISELAFNLRQAPPARGRK